MRVVVDDGDAGHLAHRSKRRRTPVNVASAREAASAFSPSTYASAMRRCRVAHHVQPGNARPTLDARAGREST